MNEDLLEYCRSGADGEHHKAAPLWEHNVFRETHYLTEESKLGNDARRKLWDQFDQFVKKDNPSFSFESIENCADAGDLFKQFARSTVEINGKKSTAAMAYRNIPIRHEIPICTQQNYGHLSLNDPNKDGWLWQLCPELRLFSDEMKIWAAGSHSLRYIFQNQEETTSRFAGVRTAQRAIFDIFESINRVDFEDVFETEDDGGSLDNTLPDGVEADAKYNTEPLWFTFSSDAEAAAKTRNYPDGSKVASLKAAKHRYAAGMFRKPERDEALNQSLLPYFSAEGEDEDRAFPAGIMAGFSFRILVLAEAITQSESYIASQPSIFSYGDDYLYVSRAMNEKGGRAVHLEVKSCDHSSEKCQCGSPGVPEILLQPEQVVNNQFKVRIKSISFVAHQHLARYRIPNRDMIIEKNPIEEVNA